MTKAVTVTVVVEWENAEAVGQEYSFKALVKVAELVKRSSQPVIHPVRLLLVTADEDGVEELKLKVDLLLEHFQKVMTPEILLAPGANYYGKKGIGIAHSTCDIAVIGDVDCQLSDNWFDTLVQPIISNQADMVYGFTLADFGTRWMEHASSLAWFFALDDINDPLYRKTQSKFRGNNFAIRTETAHKVPIPHSAGSRAVGSLWVSNLKAAGYRLKSETSAKAFHKQYDSFIELMKRAWLFGSDKDIGNVLQDCGHINRIYRSVTAFFELNTKFIERFLKVGLMRLPILEWIPVFLVGIAFQTLAAVSQFVSAVRGGQPQASINYSTLSSSARLIR
jgi:hypothetical protein